MVDTDKKVEQEVKKRVDDKIEKVEQKFDKKVEQEVKKRLSDRFYETTLRAGSDFRNEFKKQTVTAITAAFAFLIALSWREPISEGVNNLILKSGLKENLIYYKFVSAILITFLGVIFLVILTKWSSENK